jgi:hypothetical protein
MKSRHDWLRTNITRWTAIAVGIAVLTTLLPAVGPDLGPQAYAGRPEIRRHAIATSVARDRPAIDQQGTSDSSVPSAQAVFEHSSAVSEDLPPTF